MRRLFDVLTVKEVAALKGVTEAAVRKRIGRKGGRRLPAEKVGGAWLIRKVDLDAWTVQRKRNGGREGE